MKKDKFFFTSTKKLYNNFTHIFYILLFILIFFKNIFSENNIMYNISNKLIFNIDSNQLQQNTDISPRCFITNFPNPFEDFTYIYIKLPQVDNCEIKIYDLFGNIIKEYKLSGEEKYILVWDGTNFNSEKVARGGYVCVLQYMGTKIIRKIGYLR